MPDAIAVKKDAERYDSQCEVSAGMRKAVGVLSIIAALGAALFAFMDEHRLDRWCSAVVVILIVWEVAGYGVRHWEEASKKALSYRALADAIGRGAKTTAEAERELTAIGPPELGGFSRALGSLANTLQWRGRRGAALVLQEIAGVVVVVGVCTAVIVVAQRVRPEHETSACPSPPPAPVPTHAPPVPHETESPPQ
jgi:uncharacterized membrane protein YidH (DUF202 family)